MTITVDKYLDPSLNIWQLCLKYYTLHALFIISQCTIQIHECPDCIDEGYYCRKIMADVVDEGDRASSLICLDIWTNSTREFEAVKLLTIERILKRYVSLQGVMCAFSPLLLI